MKITRIEAIAVSLPMSKPIKMAGVELSTAVGGSGAVG